MDNTYCVYIKTNDLNSSRIVKVSEDETQRRYHETLRHEERNQQEYFSADAVNGCNWLTINVRRLKVKILRINMGLCGIPFSIIMLNKVFNRVYTELYKELTLYTMYIYIKLNGIVS